MINLIPKHAKKSLRVEYLIRVVSVWMILWSVALFASASILLPAYVLIGTQVAGYEQSAFEAMERVTQYENTSAALILASQEAKQIIDSSTVAPFSVYVAMIESLEGNHVRVTQIGLNQVGGVVSPIVVNGIANDRQALASFRDRLLADARVDSVDLPISNLTSDRNITFNITVTLAKESSI
ncbi:hypothetical protein KC902_03375 [Candidatus Kaiserbacteria bacterium]|nr:hypothetical protein [Candidatus Kaiserbacteria bacterium]USN89095.1 MAG: hypothetical protein H6780_01590 [Candidatus Nomurabacteria bacterium]